jgi:ATP-binding cassette subfamily F protein 3
VANKIWYIEDREIKEYPGTYDEFEFWKSQRVEEKALPLVVEKIENKVQVTPRNTPEIQQAKKELKKLEEQLGKVEKEIETLDLLKYELEEKMADPEYYSEEVKAAKIQESYRSVEQNLLQANTRWEELVDEISNLQELVK